MPKSEAEEVANLMAFAPWLERNGALELLRRCGGDSEHVKQLLGKMSDPTKALQMESVKKSGVKDAEKKTEKYFVGGGPSSGQVVLGGDSGVDNVINSLFEKARQQLNDDDEADKSQAFFGCGRRLGYTTAESPVMAPTLLQRRDVVITVYRDGYCIDKGPRLDKNSDEGVAFFRALEAGQVPERISRMYPNTAITAHLVDSTQHDTPSNFLPFAGEGRRLTGNATDPVKNEQTTASAGRGGGAGQVEQQTSFELYEGEETAKVAIVNFLGKRLEFTVNPKRHTVGDIFVLASQHAQPGAGEFQLVARDIPPRLLTDRSMSVDEAKLRNATVMMRKV